MFPCYTYRLIEIIVDQTNLGRIMAYGIIRVVKSQIGSGQAMVKPWNLPTFWFWAFSTEPLLEEGQQAKKQHLFVPILRIISRFKRTTLNPGK